MLQEVMYQGKACDGGREVETEPPSEQSTQGNEVCKCISSFLPSPAKKTHSLLPSPTTTLSFPPTPMTINLFSLNPFFFF